MSDPIAPSTEALAAPETAPAVVPAPEVVIAAPAAVATVAAPVAEATPDIHAVDEATRDALLFGGDLPAAPVTSPAPVESAVPPVSEVAPVVPPVEPVVPPADPDDTDQITKNFRLHTEDPKASAFIKAYKTALHVNPAVNPVDVARTVGYELPASPAASAAAAAVEPEVIAPAEHPDIIAARAEISEIESKIDAAFGNEGLTQPEQAALIKELGVKNRELSKLELRHEFAADRQQEASESQLRTARNAVKAQVLQDYPTANDEKSALGKEIVLLYTLVKDDPTHELHGKLADPNFTALLTQAAVESKKTELMNLGLSEAQALAAVKGQPITEAKGPVVPAVTAKPQAAPVPRNILVTAPGGKQAPEPVALSEAQVLEAARNDPKLRDNALGFDAAWIVR